MQPKYQVGGLFEGIGGFALAAEEAGYEMLWSNEIDPFCCRILRHHFTHEIKEGDIRNQTFTPVDVLCGGFPCQGFSFAGLRKGTEDDRYLWPEMLKVIDETNPSAVVAENVTGILSMEDKSGIWREVFPKVENRKIVRYDTIDQYEAVYSRQAKMLVASICEDLEERGFEVFPITVPAAGVGAPHKRDRIWILGYSEHNGSYNAKRRREKQKPFKQARKNQKRKPQGTNSTRTGNVTKPIRYRWNQGTSRRSRNGEREISSEEQKGREMGSELIGRNIKERSANNTHKSNARRRSRKVSKENGEVRQQDKNTEFSSSIKRTSSNTCNRIRQKHGFCTRWQNIENGNKEDDANSKSKGLEGTRETRRRWARSRDSHCGGSEPWRHFPVESPVCGGNDGIPRKLDDITFSSWRSQSIKGLGNAIVPQIPYNFLVKLKEVLPELLEV